MKTDIKSMTIGELSQLLVDIGEKKYRASQIFEWLSRGVRSFDEMTNLPKTLRDKLDESAFIETLEMEKLQISAKDGTRKYLFRLKSGNAIESVFLKYHYGNSVCISSQAGCRMGLALSAPHPSEESRTTCLRQRCWIRFCSSRRIFGRESGTLL